MQPFMPDGAIAAFDTSVLPGPAGLDVLDGNPSPRHPFHQRSADVFGVVADPSGSRLATPFDDAVRTVDDPFGGQCEAQTFAVEIVRHVPQPKGTTILAAFAAACCNPVLKPVAKGLKVRRKPHKLLIVGIARGVIPIANAILKTRPLWQCQRRLEMQSPA